MTFEEIRKRRKERERRGLDPYSSESRRGLATARLHKFHVTWWNFQMRSSHTHGHVWRITLILERVEEISAHFSVISGSPRLVAHA